jgi:hypothetical protein
VIEIPGAPEVNKKDLETEVILLRRKIESQDFSVPSGIINLYGGSTAPSGWLFCDGSVVGREQYPKLFEAIGTNYGSGDGTTTFGLPDLRLRFPRGAGSGSSLGDTANANTHDHAITVAQGSHAHTHGIGHTHGTGNYGGGTGNAGGHTHSVSVPGGGTSITGPVRTATFGSVVQRRTDAPTADTASVNHSHDQNAHSHNVSESNAGGHDHNVNFGGNSGNSSSSNSGNASSDQHGHTSTSATIDHIPAYTVVNYIIKT